MVLPASVLEPFSGGTRRRRSAIVAFLTAALLVTLPRSSEPHVLLDGETVQVFLLDITKYLRERKGGMTEETKLEALYLLGDKVQQFVELMNLDLMSHGKSLYAELIAKRLGEYELRIRFGERRRQYVYDLAAFYEYLKRAPRGKRAADIRVRLIAESFHRSLGKDPGELVDINLDGLRKAMLEKEAFLKDYPGHEKIRDVRFFLAMDYYRLYKNTSDSATAKRYEKLSAQALQEIVKEYPGSAEARAAEITLKSLQRAGEKD